MRGGRTGIGVGLFLIAAAFVVLKLHAVRPAVGDEGIYFYLGSRCAEGLIPYRDFVFVHPPMHIYVLALVALFSSSSFAVMKAMPGLFALLTGLALFDLTRRASIRSLLPGSWSLVPVVLFLFNYDSLRVSSHWVGVNQATFLAVAGLALWERRRPRFAGCAFAASLATATYVAPILAGVFLVKLPWGQAVSEDERRAFRQTWLSALVATLAIHLPVWILAARPWWSQTVAFQLEKPPIGSTFGVAFRQLLAAEGFLAAASLIWLLLVLTSPRRRQQMATRAIWLPAIGIALIAVLSGLERVYIYYFMCGVPFLALGCSFLLRDAWTRTLEIWQRSASEATAALGALAPLLIALIVQPLAYRSIPDVARDPSRIKEYVFSPTPGMGPVNALVSAVFVERRRVGFPAPGVWRYLWHESTFWDSAFDLAREIADEVEPEGTLYGDSTTTPLLAFLADRRVACDLADTNTLHFRTGSRSIEQDLRCAREDNLQLLVVQPRRGIDLLPEFETFARAQGRLWKQVRAGNRSVLLFQHQQARGQVLDRNGPHGNKGLPSHPASRPRPAPSPYPAWHDYTATRAYARDPVSRPRARIAKRLQDRVREIST